MKHQFRQLCTFLPTISGASEFTRLRLIYERDGKHMLESENAHKLVDAMHEHVRELRKLARLFTVECHVNLAKRSATRKK